jgi:hypothetical protein
MADFKLKSGKEINFDVYAVTHAEYRSFGNVGSTNDEEIIAKACGLTVDEQNALPEKEWRSLARAFIARITAPDPL